VKGEEGSKCPDWPGIPWQYYLDQNWLIDEKFKITMTPGRKTYERLSSTCLNVIFLRTAKQASKILKSRKKMRVVFQNLTIIFFKLCVKSQNCSSPIGY
jgi:hypothetical protein